HSPARRLARDRQQVDELSRRLERAAAGGAELRRAGLAGLHGRLAALSPLATLARGYAVVRRADTGQVLTAPAQAAPGARLRITVRDGDLAAVAQAPEDDRP
ncbi:MAG TPA: exodeoxyribonuclease VII large subunit, partial [Chloroflexaceae bacterium]|nr:exodeoxyribonuclease VII large subunit [Chloroflexaceae bacterium]